MIASKNSLFKLATFDIDFHLPSRQQQVKVKGLLHDEKTFETRRFIVFGKS